MFIPVYIKKMSKGERIEEKEREKEMKILIVIRMLIAGDGGSLI